MRLRHNTDMLFGRTDSGLTLSGLLATVGFIAVLTSAHCPLFAQNYQIVLATPKMQGREITEEGKKLTRVLDGMDVEKLWLAREYVNWRTGKPTGKVVTDDRSHTHCSSFAAAVGEKLGIYILRPPAHSATLLANAQYDWLQTEGKERGWNPVKTMSGAQERANRGEFVVAVFKSEDSKKSGHIAIVRPDVKSEEAIRTEGPQIIQAGMENFTSTTLKEGFRHHKSAWKDHLILFFSHKIDWDKVTVDTPDTASDRKQ